MSAAEVFSISARTVNDARLLVLSGELDLAGAQTLTRAVADADAMSAVVALDMRGVSFMDSSGLRGLLQAQNRLRAAGSRLLLVQAPKSVLRVLQLTGTDARFELVDSVGGTRTGGPSD